MFVSRMQLQPFKSFKAGEVVLQPGFNAIIGPNGSGKTNIVDSLLFAFGESHLRSLRVKKIRDLIFQESGVAEVTVALSDGSRVRTIKRALRKDGKIKYAIDGKRVKKYVLEEFLAQNRIAMHNVIKQGEVQRIVEMNSKDRRQMIDFIAGVSEYEDKKKEALGELQKVQSKVSEERAIIAEKQGYLGELESDKRNAEKFLELDGERKRANATVLYLDVRELQAEFETLVNSTLDLDNKARALGGEIATLEGRISEEQRKKDEVNKLIIERSEGREGELQRNIDQLQNEIDSSRALIEKNKGDLGGREKALQESGLERQKASDLLSTARKHLAELEEELQAAEKNLSEKQAECNALVSRSDAFSQQFRSARAQMASLEQEILQVREKLTQLQGEVTTAETVLRLKQDELERLQAGRFDDRSEQKELLSKHVRELASELSGLESRLRDLAVDEQRFRQAMDNLDADMLKARDRISVADARLKQAGTSRAIDAVEKIRSEIKGVYGTLQQLVDYDPQYSMPVSVALGPRMHFAVVDSVKTAGKAIDLLKKNNWGRLSFIPLDKIRGSSLSSDEKKLAEKKGAVDFLVNLLEYDPPYEKAVRFACGNTLVMNDFASAENLAGEVRLVTMDGELFEQSGLVTGGKTREEINAFAEAKELKKWEDKLEGIKAEKDAYAQKLSDARGQLAESRKRQAELEVEKTKAGLELKNILEQEAALGEKQKNVNQAASRLKGEIKELRDSIDGKSTERNSLVRRISDLNTAYLSAKEKVDAEQEQQFGNLVREKEKRVSDLRVTVADYSSQCSAKKTEVSSFEKQLEVWERRARELGGESRRLREEIDDADGRIRNANAEMRKKAEEQKRISSAMKDLIAKRALFEDAIQKLGEMKGKLQVELEVRVKPEKDKVSYKRAGVEARLTELKAQYAAFSEVELLQEALQGGGASGPVKASLIVRGRELEQEITALGPINMRAIAVFEEKTREFNQHRERLGQLENERLAVLALITEIEGRKKETFMNSFNMVNENYSRLFRQIFTGEGGLLLENADNPFEGGLTMQIKLADKDVKYLELMSGGEKSLLALIFLFALQGVSPSSIYILDEADAALDEENSAKLAQLLKALSATTQFIVVTHNEGVYRNADCLVGVAMAGREGSKLVEVKLSEAPAAV